MTSMPRAVLAEAQLVTRLGVRRALERAGRPGDPAAVAALGERWRPWRAYAVQHLWASLAQPARRSNTRGAT